VGYVDILQSIELGNAQDGRGKTQAVTLRRVTAGYIEALDSICDGATEAIQNGDKVIILSDRATYSSHGPIVVGYVDILQSIELGNAQDGRGKTQAVTSLDSICDGATEAIQNGDKVIILSDRATSADRVPVNRALQYNQPCPCSFQM
jgi:hypothetical protein